MYTKPCSALAGCMIAWEDVVLAHMFWCHMPEPILATASPLHPSAHIGGAGVPLCLLGRQCRLLWGGGGAHRWVGWGVLRGTERLELQTRCTSE